MAVDRTNDDLDGAFAAPVEQLAAAAAELRPNALLDGVFGEAALPPPPVPVGASAPRPRKPILGPAFQGPDPVPPPPARKPILGPAFTGPDPAPPAVLANPPVAAPARGPVLGPAFAAGPLPPDLRPSRQPGAAPTGAGPGQPATPGAAPADVPRMVREIRDGVVKLVAHAAKGGGAGPGAPPPPGGGPGAGGYGLGDALRPLTDRVKNTRLGQIGSRFLGRVKPAVKAMRGRGKLPAAAKGPTAAAGRGAVGATQGAATAGRGAAAAAGAEGAAGGAGAGGAAAAGVAIPVVGAVVAATAALVELAKAGVELAYQQEGRARELATYNADQAAGVAQLDVARVRRAQESGANTAGSSQANLDAINRLEDAFRPFQDAADSLKNLVVSGPIEAIAELLRTFEPLMRTINEAAEKWIGERPPHVTLQDQLDGIARDQARRQQGPRAAGDAARRAAEGR